MVKQCGPHAFSSDGFNELSSIFSDNWSIQTQAISTISGATGH